MYPENCKRTTRPPTRRELLWEIGGGLAGIALATLFADEASAQRPNDPTTQRPSHRPKAKQVIFILDACRNNPFPTGKRSSGSGLAQIQPPSGTLIAYATDPGSVASDGDQANGLYTGELVKQLKISQRIEDIFMNTRNAVEKISGGKQRPWEEARLKGVFYLK